MENLNTKANNKCIYVIDDQFHIIYTNKKFESIYPNVKKGSICHQVIAHKNHQCTRCPLHENNAGKSIIYSHGRQDWISVDSGSIDINELGKCYIIMSDSLEEDVKDLFYKNDSHSNYSEVLELDYLNDTFSIIYQRGGETQHDNLKGSISEQIRNIAETRIHPDDRQKFYDFWLLDQIGIGTVPEEIFMTRHQTFRKIGKDGTYEKVQQMFIPTRQTTQNEVFVMSFFDVLENMDNEIIEKTENEQSFDLLNKWQFIHEAEQLRKQYPEENWCLVRFDLENFKLFNEWHSREIGDQLLNKIADTLKTYSNSKTLVGYCGSDNFVLMLHHDQQRIDQIYVSVKNEVLAYGDLHGFLPRVGICACVAQESMLKTLNQADIACTSIKGNYKVRKKTFNLDLLNNTITNPIKLDDVKEGLQKGEFTFYLQPKCNLDNGKIVGAEALVRWNSAEKGLIFPLSFIPLCEKTGYISVLDAYVWESVCQWQRKMLDENKKTVPVSVNVSRIDLNFLDVPNYFKKLIEKYDLSPFWIDIEITESAFIDNEEVMEHTIVQLREMGFRVLMDDFGSGYSSLNMLKDMEVDVLKIDMKFLEFDEMNARKGIGILEAVHNMARLLGIHIVAEGIEESTQKEFLKEMGCDYGQGYHFYRPLPIDEFEKLIASEDILDLENKVIKNQEQLYLKDLLSEDMYSEVMINNLLGAVVFYDVVGSEITIKRYNHHYAELLGNDSFSTDTQLNFQKHLFEEDRLEILELFEKAKKHPKIGAEGDVHRRRSDGKDIWLHLRVFFLKEQGEHSIYYSSVSDITKWHKRNEHINQVYERQQKKYQMLAKIPGMIVFEYEPKEDRLTLEICNEYEQVKTIVTEKFIEQIHEHSWLSSENIAHQRHEMIRASLEKSSGSTEFKACFTDDNKFQWYRSYHTSITNDKDEVIRVVGRADNIENDKQVMNEWQYKAMNDAMTGLLNKNTVEKLITERFKNHDYGTCMIIDIDNFKQVNDTLGHIKGDEVICQVANALRAVFTKEDLIARLGGDEFLVYLPTNRAVAFAQLKADLLQRIIQKIMLTETMQVQCSIGIALVQPKDDYQAMLMKADIALYQAKQKGKNQSVIHHEKQ